MSGERAAVEYPDIERAIERRLAFFRMLHDRWKSLRQADKNFICKLIRSNFDGVDWSSERGRKLIVELHGAIVANIWKFTGAPAYDFESNN